MSKSGADPGLGGSAQLRNDITLSNKPEYQPVRESSQKGWGWGAFCTPAPSSYICPCNF